MKAAERKNSDHVQIKGIPVEAEWDLACSQYTGVKLVYWAMVLCMFCFEICTPKGRGGKQGGNAHFKANLWGFDPRNTFSPVQNTCLFSVSEQDTRANLSEIFKAWCRGRRTSRSLFFAWEKKTVDRRWFHFQDQGWLSVFNNSKQILKVCKLLCLFNVSEQDSWTNLR